MNTIITQNYDDMSYQAAHAAAEFIINNPDALVCFAAGDTPLGMFEKLIDMQSTGMVDLGSVYYAGLDEWIGFGYADKGSCAQVMFDSYYNPAGIPKERIHVFDGLDPYTAAQCRKMDAWIEFHGGIGIAVLGIGLNGHIGFNEPGAPDVKGCFTVKLDEVTKAVSAKYFGKKINAKQGITIGWRTLKDAEKLIIIASGENKAKIIKEAVQGPSDPSIPVSLLRDHPDLTVVIDKLAASML